VSIPRNGFVVAAVAGVATAAVLFGQAAPPRDRAQAAAAGLAQEIRALLSSELAEGGFAGAVRACSKSAQERTEEFSRSARIPVRRVSLKWRNPKDQPDEFERRVLEGWEREAREGKSPQPYWEAEGENGGRLMQPVMIQPMCLQCHGDGGQIAREVQTILADRYPGDLATGYKPGDVRGAISVRIPREP
jgi:hypothetical protein